MDGWMDGWMDESNCTLDTLYYCYTPLGIHCTVPTLCTLGIARQQGYAALQVHCTMFTLRTFRAKMTKKDAVESKKFSHYVIVDQIQL